MGIGIAITERLRLRALRRLGRAPHAVVQRANRAARILVDRIDAEQGVGPEWSQTSYAAYYVTSASVHAAVKVRAEAVSRPPLVALKRARAPYAAPSLRTVSSPGWEADGPSRQPVLKGVAAPALERPAFAPAPTRANGATPHGLPAAYLPAGPDDPLQRLLDRPNPVWTRGELLRATETYLLLWGSAYWGIERDESGRVSELWPLRPDRMRVLPDAGRYVKGYVYEHAGQRVGYLPEEVVWFRHFNPLEEFSGLASVAPARLAVDMGAEAVKFNRNFFTNSAVPGDLVITTQETPTDQEVEDFYSRWESRFRGPGKSHRPVLLSRGMDVKRLGASQRDMEFLGGLKWTVDEVARAFGVPKVFLAELEDATLANVSAQEHFLWRNTVVPELRLLEEAATKSLAPLFDEFPGQRRVQFDLSVVEALRESENDRVDRPW